MPSKTSKPRTTTTNKRITEYRDHSPVVFGIYHNSTLHGLLASMRQKPRSYTTNKALPLLGTLEFTSSSVPYVKSTPTQTCRPVCLRNSISFQTMFGPYRCLLHNMSFVCQQHCSKNVSQALSRVWNERGAH